MILEKISAGREGDQTLRRNNGAQLSCSTLQLHNFNNKIITHHVYSHIYAVWLQILSALSNSNCSHLLPAGLNILFLSYQPVTHLLFSLGPLLHAL